MLTWLNIKASGVPQTKSQDYGIYVFRSPKLSSSKEQNRCDENNEKHPAQPQDGIEKSTRIRSKNDERLSSEKG
jgi:hypothetical protein